MQNKIDLLKKIYGYTTFRNGQEELIDALLAGQDTLGIMPTGGGKSICFQIPALLNEGITLVISPLISLMSDQVAALKQLGVAGAYINSSLTYAQQQLAIRNAYNDMYKIIYVAPERLELPEFIAFAKEKQISLLIIDEAHCISQWGHDFRPSYLNIKEFLKQLHNRPVIGAFTATATEHVKNDIILQLSLRSPFVLSTGFDRPNLFFEIETCTAKEKESLLLAHLAQLNGKSGIIYCSTRQQVENLCEMLNRYGYSATRYHAGLIEEEKNENQLAFLYDKCAIMVATNAFGMGIDKSNVGFVIHYNIPKDMESYYQEAGRAGRDGSQAKCILLYSKQDIKIAEFLIEKNAKENESLSENQKEAIREKAIEKLQTMARFGTHEQCLRKFMLEYFGQKAPNKCNYCSKCVEQRPQHNVLDIAKAISETISVLPTHYGSNTIIKVLQGERQSKLKLYERDLKYFGAFKNTTVKVLEIVIQQMLNDDFLRKSDDKYNVLYSGYKLPALYQTNEYMVPLPKGIENIVYQKPKQLAVDPVLYKQLNELRKKIALQRGVPPFVIFSNTTLEELATKKPTTTQALRNISGIGETKLMNFGFEILNCIKDYENEFLN